MESERIQFIGKWEIYRFNTQKKPRKKEKK